MGMYDYWEYCDIDDDCDIELNECLECKRLKKENKKLQQLVELLRLPNEFE